MLFVCFCDSQTTSSHRIVASIVSRVTKKFPNSCPPPPLLHLKSQIPNLFPILVRQSWKQRVYLLYVRLVICAPALSRLFSKYIISRITLNHWKPTFECEKGCFGKKYFSRKRYFIYLFFYLRPFQYARPCVQVTKPQVQRFFLLDEVFIAFKLLMMIVFSDLKLFSCVIRIGSFKLSKLFSVICACLK